MGAGTDMRLPLWGRVKVMAERAFFFRRFIVPLAMRVMTMLAMMPVLRCVACRLMEMLMRHDPVRQHQGIG